MQGVTLFRTQNSNQRHLKGQPEISGLRRRSDWRWQWLCKSIPTFNDWWQQMIFSILKDNDSTAHWRSADRNTNKKDNLWKPQTKKDIRWSNNRVSSLFLIWLRFVNFFRPPSFNQGTRKDYSREARFRIPHDAAPMKGRYFCRIRLPLAGSASELFVLFSTRSLRHHGWRHLLQG